MGEIGDALRDQRLSAKIDVQNVEDATKIRAKYLRALENEEFDLLPGPSYVKSFLRTYAEYLGLDGRALVDVYRREYERGQDLESGGFAARSTLKAGGTRRPQWIRVGIAALVAVVIAVIVLGLLGSGKAKSAAGHGTQPALGKTPVVRIIVS
ncbi:MAG: helix-turn-helix domain-containing protein [Thermoleophilaceae bacterium]|nr:helix-turn-helix domain-containing protein [Thermoleophilaceae bacterium]